MYGDFSRDPDLPVTFDQHVGALLPANHHTRVLLQQGQPLTDYDWNEQASLPLEQVRALARSVIGWHGTSDNGFRLLQADPKDASKGLHLCRGHYFVDGIRCEITDGEGRKIEQNSISAALNGAGVTNGSKGLVYLDVWEDAVPIIPNPPSGSSHHPPLLPRLVTRTRWALWVIKHGTLSDAQLRNKVYEWIDKTPPDKRTLTVKIPANAKSSKPDPAERSSPCSVDSAESGAERLTLRVEIERGGKKENATFKWGIDGSATLLRVLPPPSTGPLLSLTIDKSQARSGEPLKKGEWIEILTQNSDPVMNSGALAKIDSESEGTISFSFATSITRGASFFAEALATSLSEKDMDDTTPAFIRRWEGIGNVGTDTVVLANGISVTFADLHYQRGDYWLITVQRDSHTGKVKLVEPKADMPQPARGWHHYAPLAVVTKDGKIDDTQLLRKRVTPMGSTYPGATECSAKCPLKKKEEDNKKANEKKPDEKKPDEKKADQEKGDEKKASAGSHLLSPDGVQALKRYFTTPREVLRRIPARYLKTAVTYEPLMKWLAPSLVSELVGVSFEAFAERFQRSWPIKEQDWPTFEREARQVLATAEEFSRMLATENGLNSLLA